MDPPIPPANPENTATNDPAISPRFNSGCTVNHATTVHVGTITANTTNHLHGRSGCHTPSAIVNTSTISAVSSGSRTSTCTYAPASASTTAITYAKTFAADLTISQY